MEQGQIRVAFLGLRGFPDVQGGVETHAQNLCPLLVGMGCSIEVIARCAYQPRDLSSWRGVRFRRIWAPRLKGLEAIVHSALGVLYAGLVSRPDILHIQAIGPALMTPFARLLGLRVVVTHHGPDYDRQKWGRLARSVLRLGELLGMRCANARIVISRVIATIVKVKHRRDSQLIPNGVALPRLPRSTETPARFGLEPGRYILTVGRLVPEKRHVDLIRAFEAARLPGWKLAIVGASDHPDSYVREILALAKANAGVVCTGLQTGDALSELYAHAGLFVLPSSHEGLPIALLEALSYGLPVLASAIPANLEVGLPAEQYFPLGDVEELSRLLRSLSVRSNSDDARQALRAWMAEKYDWRAVAEATLATYRTVLDSAQHARDAARS